MKEINIYTEKIGKNTLSSSDIPLVLKVLRQDAKTGLIELTKDDIHLFQVYTFALQQLELAGGTSSSEVHAGDWRQTVDDLSTLKQVIDEMEQKRIITNVSWNAGGMAIFDIPDRKMYKTFVYSIILGHVDNLYGR
ncbi:hypothetical protein [uncultured Methanolobus sp.]|uniref:hypothetical protein n=1 Tax=uncultured Methanolobus sp. TaxID=218300 RepID=UPI0029C88B53|nr:hypothetical protein [uncultured Methanolobus sp.]